MKITDITGLAVKHRAKFGWLILVLVVFYGLFVFRIQSTMPTFAPVEIQSQTSSASLTAIWQNPVNAPYKFLVWLPYKFMTESVLVTRLAASVFACATIWIFFLILKQRYSLRQAVFGTAIFATSSVFLHSARLGAPYILQTVMLLPFVLPLLWYSPKIPRNLIAYVMITLCALCLYIPGFVWLALIGTLIYRKHILQVVRSMSNKHLAIAGLLSLALVAPIVWASVRDVAVVKELFGFGAHLPSIRDFAINLLDNLKALFWKSTGGADLSLIGAPLLSAVDIVLAVFGAYHLWFTRKRLTSTYYISGIFALSLVLASLGGSVKLVMGAPFVYLFVAAGIYYLLNEWLAIFPRNPIAKRLAVAMIVVLVGVSCVFHLRSYFVAWPHNDHTRGMFVEPQPAPRK